MFTVLLLWKANSILRNKNFKIFHLSNKLGLESKANILVRKGMNSLHIEFRYLLVHVEIVSLNITHV